ncbi:ABC transporter permease [Mucilaginibacter sp. McL0603]|uniref:ABC transporter permease n=1 Tax=Mucilaginibacter sp. McL0603 TaxID=3415670 RepID=UPI003CF120B1
MIKNYLKLGLRNLAKNRLSSAINILGLGLAVGCCMVVFQFFDWSMHMDNFHHKLNSLFVIERVSQKDGNQQLWGNSPAPLGSMLKADFPQIKNTARVSYTGVIIKQGDNVFRESVTFVDDAFYSMFNFPIKWGNKLRFTDQDGIVLTNELSEKLFGKENPVGKNVNVRFNKNGQETIVNFTVKGVFDKRPMETSWYFSALVPYSKMASLGMDKTGDWVQSTDITFVEADNEASLTAINGQSKKYLQLYNAANKDDKITAFHFQPLRTMNFHAYNVNNQRFNYTHIAGYIMLVVIAIATLLLVYFNYMNIAIASASTRLKEIGVRKVMGSSRKQIIYQFILENIILCTIAIIVGLFLAKYIFLPWFSQIANIDLAKNLFNNYRTWVALVVLIIVSALSGAAYPSFYISAFKPINIIKGNSKLGSNNRFRKALLGFQFFLTFLAISTTLAFINETKQIKVRPWGYDPANNVVVTLDKSANFEAFKDELKHNSIVKSVSGSVQSLGNYSKQMVIKTEGKEETVQGINALPGFATQLGISITKGRDLNPDFETDKTTTVLVNQAFLKQMHWTTGIGKNIEYENHQYQIVGEVDNFHFENFESPVTPLVLMGCKPEDVNFVYIKTASGLFKNAHSEVEKVWKKAYSNLPFEYYYQDNVFDQYIKGFDQVSDVMGAASLIMIVISISGIFGLALLILGRKMKEISVRKVLGASIGNIIYLINKEFIFAIGFAILFGLPVSWWLVRTMFNQITPESAVSLYPLIISFIALIVMTAVSVSWHIFKAHTSNPTKYLKDE